MSKLNPVKVWGPSDKSSYLFTRWSARGSTILLICPKILCVWMFCSQNTYKIAIRAWTIPAKLTVGHYRHFMSYSERITERCTFMVAEIAELKSSQKLPETSQILPETPNLWVSWRMIGHPENDTRITLMLLFLRALHHRIINKGNVRRNKANKSICGTEMSQE